MLNSQMWTRPETALCPYAHSPKHMTYVYGVNRIIVQEIFDYMVGRASWGEHRHVLKGAHTIMVGRDLLHYEGLEGYSEQVRWEMIGAAFALAHLGLNREAIQRLLPLPSDVIQGLPLDFTDLGFRPRM